MEILIISVCTWAIAQLIKVIIVLIQKKQFDFRVLIAPGGMPSSHSATVSALVTSVAIVEGVESTLFAISAILAIIVMYDAAGLRRSVGKQAAALNRIVRELKDRRTIGYSEKELLELIGHSTFQVIVGACLGVAISLLWFFYIV
jgi:uncharacterized protein